MVQHGCGSSILEILKIQMDYPDQPVVVDPDYLKTASSLGYSLILWVFAKEKSSLKLVMEDGL